MILLSLLAPHWFLLGLSILALSSSSKSNENGSDANNTYGSIVDKYLKPFDLELHNFPDTGRGIRTWVSVMLTEAWILDEAIACQKNTPRSLLSHSFFIHCPSCIWMYIFLQISRSVTGRYTITSASWGYHHCYQQCHFYNGVQVTFTRTTTRLDFASLERPGESLRLCVYNTSQRSLCHLELARINMGQVKTPTMLSRIILGDPSNGPRVCYSGCWRFQLELWWEDVGILHGTIPIRCCTRTSYEYQSRGGAIYGSNCLDPRIRPFQSSIGCRNAIATGPTRSRPCFYLDIDIVQIILDWRSNIPVIWGRKG